MSKFTFRVEWGDTDAAGIVFYPNYYRWMDNATHELFEAIGCPTDQMIQEKLGIPILEAKCQFFTPSLFRTEVVVTTKVAEIREKVFKVEHTFHRGELLLAEGYEVRAWTSFAGERPKAGPIPEDVKEELLRHSV